MDSKSGDILIQDDLQKRCPGSFVRDEELQTESLLIQTPSTDKSTLTEALEYDEEIADSGCSTPSELIFDPFALGPEELCFSPKRRHSVRNLHRQLSFDLSFSIFDLEREFEELEKEKIWDICRSFLDLIISYVLEISEEKSSNVEDLNFSDVLEIGEEKSSIVEDGFKTPTKIPFLTGFADTCPGAPMRPALKLQGNFKSDMCRKLDFDSDCD